MRFMDRSIYHDNRPTAAGSRRRPRVSERSTRTEPIVVRQCHGAPGFELFRTAAPLVSGPALARTWPRPEPRRLQRDTGHTPPTEAPITGSPVAELARQSNLDCPGKLDRAMKRWKDRYVPSTRREPNRPGRCAPAYTNCRVPVPPGSLDSVSERLSATPAESRPSDSSPYFTGGSADNDRLSGIHVLEQ